MNNIILIPPNGIQECYISVTKVGNMEKIYNKKASINELYGAGTGKTKEEASKFANFEALERIANSINCQKKIIDTYQSLKSQTADMTKFPKNAFFEQSLNPNFDEEQVTTWIETVDLLNKEIKLIPENYIYLFNDGNYYGDRVTNPISTGAALHENYNKALINGIYEVIERDSIALTWLLRNVNGNITHLFDDFDSKVFCSSFLGKVEFYDVSTVKNIITVCAHAKAHHSKKVKNVLMFACDTNFENIKRKLKKELISVMFSFSNEPLIDEEKDFKTFTDVDQGGRFMAHYFNDEIFDFFNKAPVLKNINYNNTTFDSDQKELSYLLETLKKQNFSVFATDITCREVIAKDLKAVKVVIPELQPISFVYNSRYLASNRLKEFGEYIYGKNYLNKLNPYPLAFS
ncbi:YcaO-like family protein [Staphylococcus epidermidis]|uniref:YcaO-like family protein n=1 Tax=Staphylococcus epidermidis TaxID=1282 RepID=UPI0013690971|nr:YcaO-like family protein [Staphylococcus epidermidis]NAM30955.1 hypothetical protein [Staphylococcus epidermidis]NAM67796.1 hypothetical protein [Staphylococcus epidermidis]NAM78638.1 hypothetical protein [Staphylococcus epidermidis]